MTNLPLAVDEATLRRARIRAVNDGTSVNAVMREYLSAYADGGDDQWKVARDRFLELAESSTASSGPGGRTWTRDELYDR